MITYVNILDNKVVLVLERRKGVGFHESEPEVVMGVILISF